MKLSLFVVAGLSLLLIFMPFMGAEVISEEFNFYSDETANRDIISSSVKLEITTIYDTTCRYDESEGISYGNMDGRFDLSADKLHEKTFTGLGDGIYAFYIKCDTTSLNLSNTTEMKLVIRVNSLVTGQIVLEDDSPLRAGRTELTLLTSKVVSNSPSLTYSFDGIVYNDLPLFGTEKIWKGYLIVPKSLKESVVSFKFSANDLEGRQGTQITSGNVFLIDVVKPIIISDIEIIGFVDEIDLDWHMYEEDDIVEYNIYRATTPGVEHTDFLTSVDSTSFTDTSVDRGKTYYYRLAGLDEAGNEGDLSKEVYTTVLKSNSSGKDPVGLAPYLLGKVENFVVEVNSNIEDLDTIREGFDDSSGNEKKLIENLDLDSEIKMARAELVALGKDAEKFKLQDLSEEEIIKKIDSLEVRLGVVKKKVPETLIIKEEESEESIIDEDKIRRALIKLNGSLNEKEISKSVDLTFEYLELFGLKINSEYYLLEIVYFDGTSKEFSIVSREFLGDLEESNTAYFVESISSDVAQEDSQIKFESGDRSLVGPSLTYSFSSDTEHILYVLDEEISLSRLADSEIVFVKFYERSDNTKSNITGYFVGDFGTLEYGGLGLGILVVLALIYFVFLRRKKLSEAGKLVDEKIESLYKHIDSKNLDLAKQEYLGLKEKYKALEEREKKIFHKDLVAAHERVIGIEIEKGIEELETNKDEKLFKKIDGLYSQLSEESQKKISEAFLKVKKDFVENG